MLIWKLQRLIGKYSGVISRCLLHILKFTIFYFLNWLAPKFRVDSSMSHIVDARRNGCMPFYNGIPAQMQVADYRRI